MTAGLSTHRLIGPQRYHDDKRRLVSHYKIQLSSDIHITAIERNNNYDFGGISLHGTRYGMV